MKAKYLLITALISITACSTDESQEMPLNSSCDAYKVEINRNFNEQIQIFYHQSEGQMTAEARLTQIMQLENQRMEYLLTACE